MPGEVIWEASFGDASIDTIRAAALQSDGGLVVAGSFEGALDFGGGALVSGGAEDVFVAKLDAMGNEAWAHQYGGTGTQEATGVAVDLNDNVFLYGGFDSPSIDFGTGPLNAVDESDLFITKMTAVGQVVLSERIGGVYTETSHMVVATPSNDIVVAGAFETQVDFLGGTVGAGAQIPAAFFAQLSGVNTSHELAKAAIGSLGAQGANIIRPASLTVDSAGNRAFLLSGIQNAAAPQSFTMTYDNVAVTWPVGGGALVPLALFRTDGAGSYSWHADLGFNTPAGTVSAFPNGDILACGSYTSGSFGNGINLPAAEGRDVWVLRYSATGSLLWSRRYGSPVTDGASVACAALSDGSHLVVAQSSGDFEIGTGVVTGSTDSTVVARIDDDGEIIWSRRTTGPATVVDVVANEETAAIVLSFDGGGVGFDTSFSSSGATDVFVALLGL